MTKPTVTTQSCRTCKFLDRGDAKRLSSYSAYPCIAPLPPKPDVATSYKTFKWPDDKIRPYTIPCYGADCSSYEKRKK